MRYESDINNLKQQVDILQRELGQGAEHKKFLHLRFEEEQAAHTISQQNFAAELQVEREKNKTLEEELESISASRKAVELELKKRYDKLQRDYSQNQRRFIDELKAEREKNKFIQGELEAIKLSHNQISKNYESDVVNLKQQAEHQW